ncbi:MAG: hypothetical protein QNJ40_23700 [Xanthomonadales bacterium]|nr:hypothetical protein [Xanthomonadales bacterium]
MSDALAAATQIVSDYGQILNRLDPAHYGHPESSLPHAKQTIREAILTSFREFGRLRSDVRQGLIHGFVYLAQFVPDADAETIARGQDWMQQANESNAIPSDVERAMRLINDIKLEMERALEEISAMEQGLLHPDQ